MSYPLPTNWCTDDIDNISAYSFRANFKEDDKRLQSIDASENPWFDAPIVPLQHVANVIATFKKIQINRQNCNKNFDSFVQQREI